MFMFSPFTTLSTEAETVEADTVKESVVLKPSDLDDVDEGMLDLWSKLMVWKLQNAEFHIIMTIYTSFLIE